MEKIKPYAFLIFAGFLFSLGFPNILNTLIPFAPILAVSILIYWILESSNLKQALLRYLVYNLTITIFGFYWITATLQEFGNLPFIIAALANLLYTLILNPHLWIFIFILFFFKKKHIERWELLEDNPALLSLILASFLTLIEYFIPQQFPIMLGQPWIIIGKYLGLAKYFGIPIFSFCSYLIAIELVNYARKKRVSHFNIFIFLLFIFLNPLLSFLDPTDFEKENSPLNARLVQANISNHLKVKSEQGRKSSVYEVLNKYEDLSKKPFINNEKIDLIVWPETAYPFPIFSNKADLGQTVIPSLFQRITFETNAEILFGGYDHFKDNSNGSYYRTEYNSALHLADSGKLKNTYHKHILIPFGETLPLGPLTEYASKFLTESMAFFAVGSKKTLFKTRNGTTFTANICYEILRPEFLREYLNTLSRPARLMINLTNDSWYGNTVEPEQHLFLTRWRALEMQVPILRATNTGISTFININGEVSKRLEYATSGNLDLKLQLKQLKRPTTFQTFGIMTIFPLWVLCFLFHLILLKLKNAKTN